jgi:uncharacterized protein
VLLDTPRLIALTSKRDNHHREAKSLETSLRDHDCRFVLSQLILTEYANAMSRANLRAPASKVIRSILRGTGFVVVELSPKGWHDAMKRWQQITDKDWSLVDCHSMLVCEQRGIELAFTADRHFSQAGLRTLLHATRAWAENITP